MIIEIVVQKYHFMRQSRRTRPLHTINWFLLNYHDFHLLELTYLELELALVYSTQVM